MKKDEYITLNSGKRYYDVTKTHINKIRGKYPPSDEQREYIASLKQQLEDDGYDTSYVVDPPDREIASLVIRSLQNLCKRRGISREKK